MDYYYTFQDPDTGKALVLTYEDPDAPLFVLFATTEDWCEASENEEASRARWQAFARTHENIHEAAQAMSEWATDILDCESIEHDIRCHKRSG